MQEDKNFTHSILYYAMKNTLKYTQSFIKENFEL